MQDESVSWQRCALHVVLGILLAAALPARVTAAAQLVPLPGSPFAFPGTGSAQVPTLSPDGRRLYLPLFGSGEIVAVDVASDGTLAFAGLFPSQAPTAWLGGVALSPAGDRLYAAAFGHLGFQLVEPSGALSPSLDVPAQVPWSNPLNGIAQLSLPAGDFLYVNDNAAPSSVSAWSIGPDGTPAFVAAYPTGGTGSGELAASLIAAPRLVARGRRVFTLDSPGRFATTATSSVTVFDVAPDGTLTLAPGSPFDLGTRAGAIAVDATGTFLYAGGGGNVAPSVLKLRVLPDGSLALVAQATFGAMTGKPNGLAVDPTGRWLAFGATLGGGLAVLDTATLELIENGHPLDANAAGVVFDAAGHLYVGHLTAATLVTAYQVTTAAPPSVTCVGAAGSPAVLEADAGTCTVAVDASNGLAGACADGGGGLASCTLDGADALRLGPGERTIEVVGTAPDGSASSCTSHVVVVDVTAPLVALSPSPSVLWPPDHALVPVDPGTSAWDACDGTLAPACAVASSEPDEAAGAGLTSPDVVWLDGALLLRAERSGVGYGRAYTLTCEAVDAAGNAAAAIGGVNVPHSVPE